MEYNDDTNDEGRAKAERGPPAAPAGPKPKKAGAAKKNLPGSEKVRIFAVQNI